jgi:hypothetical protein
MRFHTRSCGDNGRVGTERAYATPKWPEGEVSTDSVQSVGGHDDPRQHRKNTGCLCGNIVQINLFGFRGSQNRIELRKNVVGFSVLFMA